MKYMCDKCKRPARPEDAYVLCWPCGRAVLSEVDVQTTNTRYTTALQVYNEYALDNMSFIEKGRGFHWWLQQRLNTSTE